MLNSFEKIEKLIELSKEKKKVMENILGTIRLQKRFIELENIDAFLKQDELKQKYITIIEELDYKFCTLFNKLKSDFNIDSIEKIDINKYSRVKNLREVVCQILKLEQEIKTKEFENIQLLKENNNYLSNKFKFMKQGKKAIEKYNVYKNLSKDKKSRK
ncbi:flagellar export chaperone FlgN [Caminicella sporogenes]|uniref:flagellar export chaperone FlgN n=1 Tax=Caminicella sporogenes TaxID=166485 RepID=UPI002540928D|nr:flagellar export chaperone FlgN [Caminicella sporogenes]WIF93906.1 flagellar export chaperone FlgN [Caminicella sporogenes]